MINDAERIWKLKQDLNESFGFDPGQTHVVRSPYRICPLGAHVDHQKGLVTGMCIDRNILLVYRPNTNGKIRLKSLNFEKGVEFSIHDHSTPIAKDWGNYPKGAVAALRETYELKYGFDGVIEGNMPIGGLSSSAAVGLAYLLALQHVNDIDIATEENIHLNLKIENGFIGLKTGILDQSTILLSQKNKLFFLDCQNEDYCLISPGEKMPQFKIIVVYSGVCKNLAGTGYNQRVLECEEATHMLVQKARFPSNNRHVLRDIPVEVFKDYRNELPEKARKRATHFFSEYERVRRGLSHWRNGDLQKFGKLINESGKSSIENYECGCEQLITIYQILSEASGVYGARFSGAGFRGSCIGLIDPAYEGTIIEAIRKEYPKRHPDIENSYEVFICESDEGARLL